jgi:hypothetical protein
MVEGDTPVSWVGMPADWTVAGLDVAGSDGARSPGVVLELAGGAGGFEESGGLDVAGGSGCVALDRSIGDTGSDVAGGGGSGVLDGCVTGSAGGGDVDVG